MLHWSIKYSVHRLYFCVSFHAHSCVHFLVWCPMAVGTLKKVFQSNEFRALKLHARTYLQWAGFPRNHLTGCEHSHQYIMCSLLPDPKLFPCISAYSLLFFHCTFAPPPPFFFLSLRQCTEEELLLPVLFPLDSTILNPKFEVIDMANMFLIWSDG